MTCCLIAPWKQQMTLIMACNIIVATFSLIVYAYPGSNVIGYMSSLQKNLQTPEHQKNGNYKIIVKQSRVILSPGACKNQRKLALIKSTTAAPQRNEIDTEHHAATKKKMLHLRNKEEKKEHQRNWKRNWNKEDKRKCVSRIITVNHIIYCEKVQVTGASRHEHWLIAAVEIRRRPQRSWTGTKGGVIAGTRLEVWSSHVSNLRRRATSQTPHRSSQFSAGVMVLQVHTWVLYLKKRNKKK